MEANDKQHHSSACEEKHMRIIMECVHAWSAGIRLTNSLTHSLTHPLTHLIHLTHSLTHSLIHSLTHSLIHSCAHFIFRRQ